MGLLSGFVKHEKKSSSKSTAVQIKCDQQIDDWLKAHSDKKDAESKLAEAESIIIPEATTARLAESKRLGEHLSSVKVNGKISFVVQNRYSEIDILDKSKISAIFGDDFDKYFKIKTTVNFTEKATNDQQFLTKMIALIGEDKFAEYFVVKEAIVPNGIFHETRSIDKDVATKADILIDSGVIKPYKPSINVEK